MAQSLRELRSKTKLKATEIATQLTRVIGKGEKGPSVTATAIASWERGERAIVLTPSQMLKLCELYGAPLEVLAKATQQAPKPVEPVEAVEPEEDGEGQESSESEDESEV